MSYHLRKRQLLQISCISTICISAAASWAGDSSSASVAQPDVNKVFRAVVNHSDWKVDTKAIKDVVYETAIKYNPKIINAADVLIADAAASSEKDLHVRLYQKNTNEVLASRITVDRASLAPVSLGWGVDIDFQSIVDSLFNYTCPDNAVEVVIAAPDLDYGGYADGVTARTITNVVRNAQLAGRTVAVLQRYSQTDTTSPSATPGLQDRVATIRNFTRWMMCPKVQFFGSISHATNGYLQLEDGRLPTDWFTKLPRSVVSNKIVFFNTPGLTKSPLWNNAMTAGVAAIIFGNNADYPDRKAVTNDVFTCFCGKTLGVNWSTDIVQFMKPAGQSFYECNRSPNSFAVDGGYVLPSFRIAPQEEEAAVSWPGTDDPLGPLNPNRDDRIRFEVRQ